MLKENSIIMYEDEVFMICGFRNDDNRLQIINQHTSEYAQLTPEDFIKHCIIIGEL